MDSDDGQSLVSARTVRNGKREVKPNFPIETPYTRTTRVTRPAVRDDAAAIAAIDL